MENNNQEFKLNESVLWDEPSFPSNEIGIVISIDDKKWSGQYPIKVHFHNQDCYFTKDGVRLENIGKIVLFHVKSKLNYKLRIKQILLKMGYDISL